MSNETTGDGRPKPTGKTGPVRFAGGEVSRRLVVFPKTKPEIEMFIAKLFCAGNAGMHPQLDRYGGFENLEQQLEDRPDFTADTKDGKKWIELSEYAPLDKFGHAYENVPATQRGEAIYQSLCGLIEKKSAKGYGSGVILVIYKTHETLGLPPPILRKVTRDLAGASVPFEAIYYLSPHDEESATVWEVYPGKPDDDWHDEPVGNVHFGLAGIGHGEPDTEPSQ